jgi:ubiquinone/menaquinone biosynthesis C-methylase UbiE
MIKPLTADTLEYIDQWVEPLPNYAPMQAAYQRAHTSELRAMLADLAIAPGAHVLDVACGAGRYTTWLAEEVGALGSVTGIDISPAYLREAQRHVTASPYADQIDLYHADVEDLPFDDNHFDLVWCAQSLYSLPDIRAALRELWRVVKPGGVVAILEHDFLHHVILPWPSELELAIRQIQMWQLTRENNDPTRLMVGRDMVRLYALCGFAECRVVPYPSVRTSPLSDDEYTYLSLYFEQIRQQVDPYLPTTLRADLAQLISPHSRSYVLHQPDFYVTYLDLVISGMKT